MTDSAVPVSEVPANPQAAEFVNLLSNNAFVFVVYYRGHWCPFCRSYISTLATLQPAIEAAGGKTLIVTSEVPEFLPEMREKTGYQGAAINDPENNLAGEMKKRGLLSVIIDKKAGYEHGMAQPGILIMQKGGPVYAWAIQPSFGNLYGAKDRPLLDEVWANAQAAMASKPLPHKTYRTTGVSKGLGQLIK